MNLSNGVKLFFDFLAAISTFCTCKNLCARAQIANRELQPAVLLHHLLQSLHIAATLKAHFFGGFEAGGVLERGADFAG